MSLTTSRRQPLLGKVALVTGASGGIGGATAIALAEAGAHVALNYLSWPEQADEVAESVRSHGQEALHVRGDISDYKTVEEIVNQIVATFGHVDILVSSVAYSSREIFYSADLELFRKTIDVTMFGAFNSMRACTLQMIKQGTGGSVVVVGSPLAQIPMPTMMAYGMAKAALDQMVRIAALELLDHRIRVNSVHPGWVDTPGERLLYGDKTVDEGGSALPNGRLGTSQEIARLIRFVLDPDADLMNGSILTADGGFHLPGPHQWGSR